MGNKKTIASKIKKPAKKVYKLAELFCGPGGIGLGALQTNVTSDNLELSIKPVWANDIDFDTCKTYAANIHGYSLDSPGLPKNVVHGPIEEVGDFNLIPKFNCLAFGFPCNDFSMVGEQKGIHGKFGPLYTHGIRAIEAQNPDWFLAENVGGIRSANDGIAFSTILKDLENAGKGYRITPHLYKFEEYGVPQTRHRVVIVGFRKNLGIEFKVPAPTHMEPKDQISVKKVLGRPLPKNLTNNDLTRQAPSVVARLKFLAPGKNAWWLDELASLDDVNLIDTIRREIRDFEDRFEICLNDVAKVRSLLDEVRLNVKSARMSHIYKRLDPDRPSYTITGSGGGGTHVYHWSEHRALTNRERARIQTFPDEFVFSGNRENVRKQIGMAVPPVAAKVILEAILRSIAKAEYQSVPANINMGLQMECKGL